MELNLNEIFDEMDAEAEYFLTLHPKWNLGDFHLNMDEKNGFSIEEFKIIRDEDNQPRSEKIDDIACSLCIDEVVKETSEWIRNSWEYQKLDTKEDKFVSSGDFHLTMDLYEGIWLEEFNNEYEKKYIEKREIIKKIVDSKDIEQLINFFSEWLAKNWFIYEKDRKRKGEKKLKYIL